MKKEVFNDKLREYVKNNITPTDKDKELIIKIYDSIKNVLGENNCIQIGSYPRFTSIRPIHDLDVLYILGDWDENSHSPTNALNILKTKLNNEYENPTEYKIDISEQTHSITILFKDKDEEVFSADIVPAYKDGANEFSLDEYRVPELIKQKHRNRSKFYEEKRLSGKGVEWIKSDPRGYIEVAKNINNKNEDFRRTVKFIKAWKGACKREDEKFKLKSFHIEQVIAGYFEEDVSLTIFDGIFKFFSELKDIIREPQIPDRADSSQCIDSYLTDKDFYPELVLQARDQFMIKFESLSESDDLGTLFEGDLFYKRHSLAEDYLFDARIPTLIDDDIKVRIEGYLERRDGFLQYSYRIKQDGGRVEVGNLIKFELEECNINSYLTKWKVKNDNSSAETRGDITNNRTKYYPEKVAYLGNHYVECYIVKDNECIAKVRQDVIVEVRKGYIPR